MTLTEAIDIRRSRRKYLAGPIEETDVKKLQKLIDEFNIIGDIRMEFVHHNGNAFGGLRKSYGLFSGVQNYVMLIADKSDMTVIERLGYYGELLLLNAVAMGFGTCWVGGSFDRKLCPVQLFGNELIICTITIGYAAGQLGTREKFIHGITHRKTKSIEDMMSADPATAPVPDWFMNGMKAVQKAPSAVNRQPVVFTWKDGRAFAGVKDYSDISTVLDFGIAKQHFELAAGRGKWNFGNNAEFIF